MTDTVDGLIYTRDTKLADGIDLNTVVAAGFYDVAQPLNAPSVGGTFYLEVMTSATSSAFAMQRLTQLNPTADTDLAPRIFVRTQQDGAWSPWTEIYTQVSTPGLEQGVTGAQGPQGPQGPAGPQGSLGSQGPIGATGPIGMVGPQGPQGVPGPAGAVGPAGGPAGDTGPAGPQGVPGPTGDTGPVGATGSQGEAGPAGPQGSQGDTGPTGPQGEKGDTGPAGPQGETGSAGPQGEKGDTGPAGPQGETGSTGPQGEKGDTGPAGPQGQIGPAGPAGDGGFDPASGSKIINGRASTYNLADYGFDVNDTTGSKNVAGFKAALADLVSAGGGTIVIPHGTYLLNATIGDDSLVNASVRIVGSDRESKILFSGSGITNGLGLNAHSVALEGFRIKAVACPDMTSGSLVYIRNSTPFGSEFGQIVLHDIGIEGNPDARPGNFLAINNPSWLRASGVGIVSFSNESFGTTGNGIYVFGEANGLGTQGDCTFYGCNVVGTQNGIVVVGGTGGTGNQTVEGVSFTDCVMFGIQTGFHFLASGYQCPGHSWKGGHINFSHVGMVFDSIAQFTVSDVLFYMDSGSASNQGFILTNGCTMMNFHNNMFNRVPESGSDVGASCWGVAFANGTTMSRATNNDGIGFPAGSALIYNQSGGNNRAGGNGQQGGGRSILAGANLIDLGGNHNY